MASKKKESKTDIIRRKREEAAVPKHAESVEPVTVQSDVVIESVETTNLSVVPSEMVEVSDDIQIAPQNEDSTVEIEKNEEKKVRKKAPGSGKGYKLEESLGILKMFNEGKSIDEISRISKRPMLSLMYKYKNPKRGYMKPKTYFDIYKAFPDVQMDEDRAEKLADEWLEANK